MFDNELYIKTFSKLKASEDTFVEVMKMTTESKLSVNELDKLDTDFDQQAPRRTIKRGAVIAAAVVMTLTLATTVLARGEEIITYLGNNVWGMAVSEGYPVKGYALARETGEFLAIDWVVDGETIGIHKGYMFGTDITDGKYTLQNIAFGNGEMILIKPGDTNGFSLKAGENISIYAELNTSPRYADNAGELTEVGYYIDGEVYEAFTGKLASGGVVFSIVAPCDGEFMIFLKNCCAGLQNYAEISVY